MWLQQFIIIRRWHGQERVLYFEGDFAPLNNQLRSRHNPVSRHVLWASRHFRCVNKFQQPRCLDRHRWPAWVHGRVDVHIIRPWGWLQALCEVATYQQWDDSRLLSRSRGTVPLGPLDPYCSGNFCEAETQEEDPFETVVPNMELCAGDNWDVINRLNWCCTDMRETLPLDRLVVLAIGLIRNVSTRIIL